MEDNIRNEIGYNLRQSGYKVRTGIENDFYKLINSSSVFSNDDIDNAIRLSERAPTGSEERNTRFEILHNNAIYGKSIGNIIGALGGALGYMATIGSSDPYTLKNIALASGIGLISGKVSGLVGKVIGFKKGIRKVEERN